MKKVRCCHLDLKIMHNVSIPLNDSKLRGQKHDFGKKSAGGRSSYGVIAP